MRGRETRESAEIDDIELGDDEVGRVEAFLVRPRVTARGPRPGLVLWHWFDTRAADGDRTEFRDEAVELAADGFVSLLPQGRFPWGTDPTGSAADAEQVRLEVARFRLALDLLVAHEAVDASRLGAVGHDFGAMIALVAAAEDERVAAVAAVAPTPRWGDWFLPFWPIEEDRIDYLGAMRRLDPVEAMARVAPRPVLLQMAQRDFYVPLMAGLELRRAAGEGAPVELKSYDAEHDMRLPEARADRRVFLTTALLGQDA